MTVSTELPVGADDALLTLTQRARPTPMPAATGDIGAVQE